MVRNKIIEWQNGWRIVFEGFRKLSSILEGVSSSATSFTAEEYMNIFTTIYNMITQKSCNYSDKLYEEYKNLLSAYIEQMVLPSLREGEHDLGFLRELNKSWLNHKVMVKWFSRHFHYLDRYYIPSKQIATITEVGLACFRDLVHEEMKFRARDIIFGLIDQEREGLEIDRALVKSVISMFVELGKDTELYEKDFEAHMLDKTSVYYSRKASRHIEEDSCPSYMLMAEECLQREKDRVPHYLHSNTEPKLLMKTRLVLLFELANQLLEKEKSGLHVMLRDNQVEDLSRMYMLFSKIDKGLEPPSLIFKEHIKSIGEALVKEAEEAIWHKKAENKGNTIEQEQAFIDKVIQVHKTYLSYCNHCFMKSTIFHKALQEAFESFCNVKIDGISSAEILATVCDSVIQKSGAYKGLDDDDAEKKLEEIVILLAYLYEKDVFAEFCRKKLSNRLLQDRNAREELEKCLLTKLKQQFGVQFTSKMEGMVTDLTLTRDKQADFEQCLADNSLKNPGLGLNVTVLTTGYWPTYKSCNLNAPAEMIDCIEVYSKYYESKTMNRKLTWVFSLGNCNLIGRFEQKPIELQVSVYQAAILLLFNASDKMGFQEIMALLNIPENELKRMLHSLSCGKYKILMKEPNTRIISSTDIFEFNSKFTDKMRRIKVQVPVPSLEEKKKVVDEVEKDRRYSLDATIVRIMKSRKVLRHQELVVETMQVVKQIFKPNVRFIKDRIEDLIQREFLERDSKDSNMYRYLA